jgi:hypothetical protein
VQHVLDTVDTVFFAHLAGNDQCGQRTHRRVSVYTGMMHTCAHTHRFATRTVDSVWSNTQIAKATVSPAMCNCRAHAQICRAHLSRSTAVVVPAFCK